MRINDLSPMDGSRKNRKRVGRGPGSGHGKTSCRGHKGQKARSGGNVPRGFEGGQMPLQRRLPKRGFTNIFKIEYCIINIKDLNRFDANTNVGIEELLAAGLIKHDKNGVKLLGDGEISQPLKIKVDKISKTARSKIEQQVGR